MAIIRGAAGDPVHNLREGGAKEAMEKAGLKVVAVQPADSDRAKGQTVAENLLTANPNLKGIFATNDEMALGAANAAKSAGKTLVIVGFDATNDALTADPGRVAERLGRPVPDQDRRTRHPDRGEGRPRAGGRRLRQHRRRSRLQGQRRQLREQVGAAF